jgi:glutathione peroxidase
MASAASAKSFFDLTAIGNDGKPFPLKQFEGKVVLVVNVASKCGYTKQYKGLQALYEKYRGKGLVVVGFPSNDFGQQEPGTDAEIKKFCELNYKVSFPLMKKAEVTGEKKQPVYRWLTEETKFPGEVSWNFEKFVVNKKGDVVARFKSGIDPESAELTEAIEKAL